MSAIIADPIELRRRGFEALVQALGWVNAVRFLRQYDLEMRTECHPRDAPGLGVDLH